MYIFPKLVFPVYLKMSFSLIKVAPYKTTVLHQGPRGGLRTRSLDKRGKTSLPMGTLFQTLDY